MLKKVVCSLALIAALTPFLSRSAVAQDKPAPVPSLDWIIASRPVPGTLSITPIHSGNPMQPSYCSPCLFYGGDINANAPTADGFANENTLLVPDTTNFFAVWVPVGSTWTVTGLFTNDLADGYDGIDPAMATWSISSGMKNKTPGTIIASGTASATFKATGRNAFGFNEYTTEVAVSPSVSLASGEYWISVVPQCTNSGDSNCDIAQYFFSNTTSFTNSYGPRQPRGNAHFNSSYFGFDYSPTCFVSTDGCLAFSGGVEGTD